MKKIAIILFVALIALPSFAQGKYGKDSAECVKYLSYYQEYVKQKNYKDAAEPWRQAISLCPPTASQNLLIHGQTILRNEINLNKANAARVQEMVDSLLMLHDIRAEYYPNNAVKSWDNKGVDMSNYNAYANDPAKRLEQYNKVIATVKSEGSPVVYVKAMDAAVEAYKANLISGEDVMNKYTEISDYMESLTSKPEYAGAKQDVESLLISSGVASCDNLIALYTPRYEANPADKDALSSMVKMMTRSECIDADLYLKAVESLQKVDPSSSSAYYLYRLYNSKGQLADASAALTESINLLDPEDVKTMAERQFELAVFEFQKQNHYAAAVAAAKKAFELDPSMTGKAYLLIGTIWSAVPCGGDEVAQRSKYWVAVDYMQKAINADESIAEEARSLQAQYRRYFPNAADAFMFDAVDGNSYSVSCGGMHETTTVRTQK